MDPKTLRLWPPIGPFCLPLFPLSPFCFPFSPSPDGKNNFPALCLFLLLPATLQPQRALAVIQPFTPVINSTHTTTITVTRLLHSKYTHSLSLSHTHLPTHTPTNLIESQSVNARWRCDRSLLCSVDRKIQQDEVFFIWQRERDGPEAHWAALMIHSND